MKHTSIDPCTRVPKNCKYTLKLYFTVYNYVYVVFVILMNIQSSQPSRAMMIAQDWLSIARHLLHYIAQYCNTGELTRVSFHE